MKNLYILIVVLVTFSINVIKSQTFDFTISPTNQTIMASQTAEFEITITPIDGFDGTIFFKSDFMNSKFNKNSLNYPYDSLYLKVSPSFLDSGAKTINITAINGNLIVSKSITLNVLSENTITLVKLPKLNYTNDLINKNIKQEIQFLSLNSEKQLELYNYDENRWNQTLQVGNLPLFGRENNYNFCINGDSLWLVNYKNLILVENDIVKIYNNIENDEIYNSYEGVFLDNEANTFILNNNNKTITLYKLSNGILKEVDSLLLFKEHYGMIKSMYYKQFQFDVHNNLWAVNKDNELFKYSDNFNLKEKINNINGINIAPSNIIKDENNSLWFLEEQNLKLYCYLNNNLILYNLPNNISFISSIYIKDTTNFWVSNYNTLFHYENGSYTTYEKNLLNLINNNRINDLTLDNNDNLWLNVSDMNSYIVFNPNGLIGVPIISSVENEDLKNNALIFPNPSSDKISLDLGGVVVADLVVYDILGNEIITIPNYTNKSEIDISTLSIGTYIIQIQTSTGSVSQRFVKY